MNDDRQTVQSGRVDETARCGICRRHLDIASDPQSEDCGGHCLRCMADAGDPDCVQSVSEIQSRGASTGEKPQSAAGLRPILKAASTAPQTSEPQSPRDPRVGQVVLTWPGAIRMLITAVLPDGSLRGRRIADA